jgi:hypothetical protein
MVLGFFKNKDEVSIPPDIGKEEYNEDKPIGDSYGVDNLESEEEEIKPRKENISVFKGSTRLEIERLNAKLDSIVSWINQFYERFAYLSENIGELRAMNLENEKNLSKATLEAQKAVDIVKEIKPEELEVSYRKLELKIKTVEERIEAVKQFDDGLMEQIKELRARTENFVGVESLLKLNEDTKNDLLNLKKLELNVRRHADKSEQIFIELKKETIEEGKLSESLDSLENSFNLLKEEHDKMKIDHSKLINEEEFDELKKTTNTKFLVVNNNLAAIKDIKELHEGLTTLIEKILRMTKSNKEQIDGLAMFVGDDSIKRVSDYESKLMSLLKIIDTLAGEISEIKTRLGQKEEKIKIEKMNDEIVEENRFKLENIQIHPEVVSQLMKKPDEDIRESIENITRPKEETIEQQKEDREKRLEEAKIEKQKKKDNKQKKDSDSLGDSQIKDEQVENLKKRIDRLTDELSA